MTPIFDEQRPAASELFLGKVVAGNFRIERLIGCGAMGNVYQAEQLSLGKAVAVKVLHPHLMSDEKLIWRFQREAKSASRLNHPNSIQIIDSGRDGGGALYIAMELLDGRDLSQIIRDEFPLPIPRIVRIMTQVLSALDEAHAQGVIHRDLKPSNIMLIERRGEPDFVKVCDYGIAKAQSHGDEGPGEDRMLTAEGLVCGTPEYMSPEQARGEPLDGRSDLYSAAVILYQMVTGDIPFRAATPIGVVSRHLSETPTAPSERRSDPSIPADLDDLILRGLAKAREQRPDSAMAFREELEDIGRGRAGRRARGDQSTLPSALAMSSDPRTHTTLSGAPPARRQARTSKALAIGLVLGACLLSVGMVAIRRARMAGISAPPRVNASAMTPAATPEVPSPPGAIDRSPGTALPGAARPLAVPGPDRGGTGDLTNPRSLDQGRNEPASGTSLGQPTARGQNETASSPRPGVAIRDRDGSRAAAMPLPAVRRSDPAPGPGAGAARVDPSSSAAARAAASPAESAALPDPIREAERLLAQGQVAEACQHGEAAKLASPRAALSFKFLGKCYMRAGDPGRAKENYRRYLELSPGAPDAMFIESIVK